MRSVGVPNMEASLAQETVRGVRNSSVTTPQNASSKRRGVRSYVTRLFAAALTYSKPLWHGRKPLMRTLLTTCVFDTTSVTASTLMRLLFGHVMASRPGVHVSARRVMASPSGGRGGGDFGGGGASKE